MIFPKMPHLRAIDSGPPGSVGRGCADQKNSVLCPDPEPSHQLTASQPPPTAGFHNLSLRGCEIPSGYPSKNAIEPRQQPRHDKPFRLLVKLLKHEPKEWTILRGSVSDDLNSFKAIPLWAPLYPPENLPPFSNFSSPSSKNPSTNPLSSTNLSPLFLHNQCSFPPSFSTHDADEHSRNQETKHQGPPQKGMGQVENTEVQMALYKSLSFLIGKWRIVSKSFIFIGLRVTHEMCF